MSETAKSMPVRFTGPMALPESPALPVKDILGKRYDASLKEAFPDVDPGIIPFGYLILLQIRTPKATAGSKGLILKIDDTKDAEKWRVQTGLVRAMGPSAFKRRDTLAPWPEGDWCQAGDFVRCPIWGGDRWEVDVPGNKAGDKAIFMMVKDTDLIGKVTTDPMNIITS